MIAERDTNWRSAIKWDGNGLVPTVVQDAVSKEVLMLAYMNEDSLGRTIETGQTWFWSRSRGELWNKGATSGHIQKVKSVRYDCDGDTLLVLVDQVGPACHTGKYSCFSAEIAGTGQAVAVSASPAEASAAAPTGFITLGSPDVDVCAVPGQPGRFDILSKLESVIAQRDAERPEGAYTTYLFEKGVDKILKKVGEEAAEVIIAAKNRDNDELRYEASDLIFHLLVLLREQRLSLDDIMAELDRRHVSKSKSKE
ncbi:bifunctional phosphoribosyl-AMP cyclohydrolase/phosphoribosyl-ATP diphosphatase HisIE [Paenibacillus koleovorans]|uniref:bifunctional phosphoribosyl-AMP cyclohydrolase/phosphoribosyl-ATP diphosphatase HisIE n=1 Tax=Paenibacillus koleovorans TaxID=121608 RepID=UPI000FD961DD|nr:bifunctional phosphoribosyl-AMP cyclohydrolase/phosphoribosyl-ATP diphosphatase HisIE [Paenibacillus koleovorans]